MDRRTHIKSNLGFSTIELMIAMAIMVVVMSAVIVTSFGTQSFLSGTQTNAEAMKIAQGLLEQQQARGRKDFNLVNAVVATPVPNDIFTTEVQVKLLPDFLTKEVKAIVTWKDERQMDRILELTTLISNFESPIGSNTCDSTLSGDWNNPQVLNSETDFATLVGDPDGVYLLSDVDAYKDYLYVTASRAVNSLNPSDNSRATLFVFDITDPTDPSYEGSEDNDPGVTKGLNAVRVAEDPSSSRLYAFTASNTDSVDYNTCNPVSDPTCGQFVIFDVTNESNPNWTTNLKIQSATPVIGTNTGQSLFYKNGYVLLGLSSATGPEFHMIDVHDLAALTTNVLHLVSPIGSYEVGGVVNDLFLRGVYAYLAVDASQELKTLDLSDPSNPDDGPSGSEYGFDAPSGAGHGKSMYLLGDDLYLGKTVPNAGEEFHILNNSDPTSILTEIGAEEISDSINDIIVRDYLAFLLTNNELQIFDISDPSNPTLVYPLPSTLNPILVHSNTTEQPSMDCQGNYLFIISNDSSDKGELQIVSAP